MLRYFISDLHLSDKRLDLIQAFVHLTDEICQQEKPCELYILGDFFEAYIGDDYQPDWMKTLDQQFEKLHQYRVNTYFIVGNRDFLIGQYWLERNHVIALPEQAELETCDKVIALAHGDEFCVDDKDYQEFRAMVRQPAWQQQVLSMPLEQRLALAQKLRNDSKSSAADKSMAIMDVNNQAIVNALPEHTSLLIHGHTHRPAFHQNEAFRRLVLGDWDDFVWCAILSGTQLNQYSIETDKYIQSKNTVSSWHLEHHAAMS
ncbi:UDP-2,3-diacylglucosamine diphosphatase [Marinomonas ostreistagni]|uniref:UDP-2,3-diacylglucosamine hydrolase n=1 Tax=Marinomonas ostreistagni TaxID=359209 RepID=A0ABS0ZDX4_9GAMM|nr:UDP-2,3-diacylglucosamine diphosphatase [Marinomonas ostreistagni]MBJ7551878.1 UDP-2,3-diacylglucosamine diphosphatase [Marinomonas ostreistagni]